MEKNRIQRFVKSVSMLLFGLGVQTAYAAYDGTPVTPNRVTAENYAGFGLTEDEAVAYADYYAITSAEELYGFAALVNMGDSVASAVLINDITVNENVLDASGALITGTYAEWIPIGSSTNGFGGKFDGRLCTISGLYRSSGSYVGLFGLTKQYSNSSRPQIDNVIIRDSYFKVGGTAGGMVGWCNSTDMHNCYVEVTLERTSSTSGEKVGGLVGWTKTGFTATRCGTNGHINASNYLGGIIGGHDGGSVSLVDCYSNTRVIGNSGWRVAGVCGYSYLESNVSGSNVIYCQGSATVSGTERNAFGALYGNNATEDKNPAAMRKMTAKEFQSGKVAWTLNKGKTDGTQAWYQEIGVEEVPVLSKVKGQRSKVVYASLPCESAFANSQEALEHHYDNGFCTGCDDYEPAPLSADGYYEVSNGGQLYWIAKQVNGADYYCYEGNWYAKTYASITPMAVANIRLMNDIKINEDVSDGKTLNSNSDKVKSFRFWPVIGQSSTTPWGGVFDGQGHSISGLYRSGSGSCVGLFGYVKQADESRSTIKNVELKDSYIYGMRPAAGIAAYAYRTDFECCLNHAFIQSSTSSTSGYYVGGIAGNAYASTFESCGNTGGVRGYGEVGGIVGGTDGTKVTIRNCYSTGAVYGADFETGAIIGYPAVNITHDIANNYYLENSASSKGYQNGIGTSSRGYTTADTPSMTRFATSEDFKSGKVAWELNRHTTDGMQTWYQEIGVDTIPVLSKGGGQRSKVVYASLPCESTFANSQEALEHHYENGFCTGCDDYEPAPLSADGYYEVSNGGQLYWMAKQVNGGYKYNYRDSWYWKGVSSIQRPSDMNIRLMQDIKVNEGVSDGTKVIATDAQKKTFRLWTPIGRTAATYWVGELDGQGHTISGLYQSQKTSYIGLLGYVGQDTLETCSNVHDLSLQDSYMYGSSNVAGIAGCAYKTTFTHCQNGAYVNSENSSTNRAGGIAGFTYSAVFESCGNTGDVYGYAAVGGIAGDCGKTKISIHNCFSTGKVRGTDFETGAILGEPWSNITHDILNCYYLENSAFSKCYQNGIGCSSRGYSSSDKKNQTISCKQVDFQSGKVCYRLNGSIISGEWHPRDTETPDVWYQTLSRESTPRPNASSYKVIALSDNYYYNEVDNILTMRDGQSFDLRDTIRVEEARYVRPQAANRLWGTLCLPFEVKSDQQIQYYSFQEVKDGMMKFNRIETVEAGTPVLYRRRLSSDSLTVASSNVEVIPASANMEQTTGQWTLRGTFTEIATMDPASEENQNKQLYYISQNKVWYAANAFRIPPYRCWFEVDVLMQTPGGMASALLRSYSICVDDDIEESINDLIEVNDDGSVQIPLDLLGRRVKQQKAGEIYVENGKKIIKK